ncbi:MAG: NAD-dependent epimerase/dehydratase family protein, partial [Thermodesulfobacteriota bacterium]
FDTNVMGTLNLIKTVQKTNLKQFIFASSEWVYDEFVDNEEKNEESPINIENHSSEYALSKLVSESNLRQQYNQGFCDVTILRFGIIYGPRKSNWSAVESILSSAKNKSEVTVGSLRNGRRFIHVSDIAYGIIRSVGIKGYNVFNLTGNQVITMKDIIETSKRILGKSVKITETNPSDVNIRNPSNAKAKRILGWEPVIDLENGLKTVLPFV